MCKKAISLILQIGQKKTVKYAKNFFLPYRIKFVILVNVFIFLALYYIEQILYTDILFQVVILIIGIVFVVVGLLNGVLILEESKGDLQNAYFRIYYCASFLIAIGTLAVLIFLLITIIL